VFLTEIFIVICLIIKVSITWQWWCTFYMSVIRSKDWGFISQLCAIAPWSSYVVRNHGPGRM